MKTKIVTLFWLLSVPCFAQEGPFQLGKRINPAVKQEKLKDAVFVGDITPELWPRMNMPYKDRYELDQRSKHQGYYNYNTIVDIVLVRVSTNTKGKTVTAMGTGNRLNTAQKNILQSVASGGDIDIEIVFKYKNGLRATGAIHPTRGKLVVTAVPEQEAEFPCKEAFAVYLQDQISFIAKQTGLRQTMMQAIVTFTINEQGRVEDAAILRTTTDRKADQLLLEAIIAMPKWKPATNAGGTKVKQLFNIRMGADGC